MYLPACSVPAGTDPKGLPNRRCWTITMAAGNGRRRLVFLVTLSPWCLPTSERQRAGRLPGESVRSCCPGVAAAPPLRRPGVGGVSVRSCRPACAAALLPVLTKPAPLPTCAPTCPRWYAGAPVRSYARAGMHVRPRPPARDVRVILAPCPAACLALFAPGCPAGALYPWGVTPT